MTHQFCNELPDNWKDSFFSDLNVNQATIDINDSDDNKKANDDYNEEEVAATISQKYLPIRRLWQTLKILYSFCSQRETLIR